MQEEGRIERGGGGGGEKIKDREGNKNNEMKIQERENRGARVVITLQFEVGQWESLFGIIRDT